MFGTLAEKKRPAERGPTPPVPKPRPGSRKETVQSAPRRLGLSTKNAKPGGRHQLVMRLVLRPSKKQPGRCKHNTERFHGGKMYTFWHLALAKARFAFARPGTPQP